MSVKWMSYIWEERTDLKGSELYCAIAIADHADADGRCFPGIKTIAMKMRLKERQVQDLIKRLESKNVFDVERGDGRGNLTSFKFKRVQDSAIKGAGFCTERVQDSARPIYKDEPSIEPSINRGENAQPQTAKKEFVNLDSTVDKSVLIFHEVFNHLLPIHTQAILTAEKIKDSVRWRQILTDAKAGMTPAQLESQSYVTKQAQYALKDYRRETEKINSAGKNNGYKKPLYVNGKRVLEKNDPLNPYSGQFVY